MTDALAIVILAVIQGVTEFLPVSSSGHLVVFEAIFEHFDIAINGKLTLNIVLHVGTLAAIVVYYWSSLFRLLKEDRKAIGLIVVGTIPAVVIGLSLKEFCEPVLESPIVAGICLPITGLVLLWSARHQEGDIKYVDMGYRRSVLIGLFQAAAILPGISRSGSTIVAGLGNGLRRDDAATYSFLLAVPAIAGAGLLETVKAFKAGPPETPISLLILGGVVSFVVGYGSLAWLVRWVHKGVLHWFAWWVIPLGSSFSAGNSSGRTSRKSGFRLERRGEIAYYPTQSVEKAPCRHPRVSPRLAPVPERRQ